MKTWIKKTTGIAMSLALAVTTVPISAFAAGTTTRTAYLYSADNTVEMSCIDVEGMPVPYVAVDEYFNNVYTINFTCEKIGDNTYLIDNGKGTMVLDAFDDTIHFDAPEIFLYNDERYDTTNPADRVFERTVDVIYKADHATLDIDLSEYNIDIKEEDGKVYLPLTTIADLAGVSCCTAVYGEGKISFNYSMSPQFVNWQANLDALERTPGEIEFTYNELCLVFDKYYGCPGNCEFADEIADRGLDGFLSNYSDETREVKRLLQSESTVDYVFGIGILGKMLADGAHTMIFEAIMSTAENSEAVKQFLDLYDNDANDTRVALLKKYINKVADEDAVMKSIRNYENLFDQYTPIFDVEEGSQRYRYFEYNNTGIFAYTNYDDNVVRQFKRALDIAKEHGMKNFILDEANNGGGSSESLMYMMNAVTNLHYHEFLSNGIMTGNRVAEVLKYDMDQDGKFEGEEEDFDYDFNYAVMCSARSFSCGNLFPCLCKEEGIPIIGETSGGGTDTIAFFRMPLGNIYQVSAMKEVCYKTGENVEKGAAPDYDITIKKEDGTIDYTNFYDFKLLDQIVNDHYKTTAMHRLYNPNSGEHFYTANAEEKDDVVEAGWTYEGIAWTAPKTSNAPVYRVYNPNSGEHFYTTDISERDILTSLGWSDEGIGWYSAYEDEAPVYRLYNPNATGVYEAGAHFYTTKEDEKDNLDEAGWNYEGIGWYGE